MAHPRPPHASSTKSRPSDGQDGQGLRLGLGLGLNPRLSLFINSRLWIVDHNHWRVRHSCFCLICATSIVPQGLKIFMKKETEKPTVLLHDQDRQYCRCREFSRNKVVSLRDGNKKVHESTSTCQKCSSVNLIFFFLTPVNQKHRGPKCSGSCQPEVKEHLDRSCGDRHARPVPQGSSR